jgi:FtsP/CotA-like multicopper oxidase with cupredoxin domain
MRSGNGGGMGGMGGGGGGGGGMSFTIDGRTFDPRRTDLRTRLGRVEDWTITNNSAMDHPFHLHVWPFRVLARSDDAPLAPGWKDTVNVPAGGSVTVRIPFDRVPGRTVYHCHILDHEDLGMMGVIRVDP